MSDLLNDLFKIVSTTVYETYYKKCPLKHSLVSLPISNREDYLNSAYLSSLDFEQLYDT